MTKINQTDIEALIEVSTWLKSMANVPDECESKKKFNVLHQHVRKVYMVLLQASDFGQQTIEQLMRKGLSDETLRAAAIRTLCPDIGQN